MNSPWRTRLSDAADLALLGIATTIASLPIITAGAAIATASAAAHERCVHGDLPSIGTSTRRFVRAIVPGCGATLAAVLLSVAIVLDIRAVVSGTVPGGPVAIVALLIAGGSLIGFAGLTVTFVGRQGGAGWLAAARAAVDTGLRRPGLLAASAGIGVLALLLAVAIPATAPLTVGYTLFALHAVIVHNSVSHPKPI